MIGGTRVSKAHLRIEAYGTIDELNSYLGLLKDQDESKSHRGFLKRIQDKLFTIGSLLASDPEKSRMKLPEINSEDIEALENSIDQFEKELPQLTQFVLPGGLSANSIAHIVRCVCRRAERLVVALDEQVPVSPLILQYLNRLSDWLFVYSRVISYEAGAEEVTWEP